VSEAFQVAVVGAGIVGAAVAYECASRGARVLLLERDEPGRQASGAAAGMLAPCSEAHQPGPFLAMGRESLSMWPQWADRIREDGGGDPELELCGLLRVAADEEASTEVRERLRRQSAAGIEAGRWLEADEARDMEPALAEGIVGAAWYPGEGHVHSPHAVRALVEAARRRGATVRTGVAVVGPAHTGCGLRLQTGEEVQADGTVLAAGARLGGLTRAFGAELPVRPVHGQLVALRDLPRIPGHVLFGGLLGYAVAKRDGLVLVGATEEDRGFDTTPHDDVTQRLRRRAAGLLRGADQARTAHTWAGLRPCAPDKLPLLGPLPGSDDARVLVAGAHYRNGVLLAPVTARGMADMLLDGRTPPGWQAYDPRRLG
jgi:glycine oxidase